jgi:MOSC domain-containing protein YiiM
VGTIKEGRIKAISVSDKKGVKKRNVPEALFVENSGIEGDAHAGSGIRQVSLLSDASIGKMREKGLKVSPGDFAENITFEGFDLLRFPVGTKLRVGEGLLEVSQIGKVCHDRCAIYHQAGDCVMPREGIFAKVLEGGLIKVGDKLEEVK